MSRRHRTILDLPAYMRAKNKERRAEARRRGVCIECVRDPADEGHTKCRTCLDINAAAQRERRAA